MNQYILNMTGFVHHMTGFVLNITVFVLNMAGLRAQTKTKLAAMQLLEP